MKRKEIWAIDGELVDVARLAASRNVKGYTLDVNEANAYQLIPEDEYTSGNESLYNLFIASILGNEKDKLTLNAICINILTVARNCYNKDKKLDEWMNDIEEHLDQYKRLVIAYGNTLHSTITCIFYLPTYDAIPNLYRRTLTDTRKVYLKLYTDLSKMLKPELYNFYDDGKTSLYTFRCLKYPLPHRQLQRALVGKVPITRKVALLSHCTTDMHLYKYYNDLVLLESYTGKVIPRKQFGLKVFGVPYVPFNIATHIAFGDKEQIRPFVKWSKKKELLQVAQRHNWPLMSEESIRRDIANTTLSPASVFSGIKV